MSECSLLSRYNLARQHPLQLERMKNTPFFFEYRILRAAYGRMRTGLLDSTLLYYACGTTRSVTRGSVQKCRFRVYIPPVICICVQCHCVSTLYELREIFRPEITRFGDLLSKCPLRLPRRYAGVCIARVWKMPHPNCSIHPGSSERYFSSTELSRGRRPNAFECCRVERNRPLFAHLFNRRRGAVIGTDWPGIYLMRSPDSATASGHRCMHAAS